MKQILFFILTCTSINLLQGQCSATVTGFPFSETFESGLGLWSQAVDDGFNWTRQTGGTPSSGTGPSGAANGGYYIYTDSRSPNSPWKTAILNSPCIDFTDQGGGRVYFFYHMNGNKVGWIQLQASTDNGANWTVLWGAGGKSYGDTWIQQHADLSAYAGQTVKLRFVVTMNSGPGGDIALDDISVTSFAKYQAPVLSDENYILSRTYQRATSSATAILADRDVVENVTYFDGLGRPKQQVAVKASPDNEDIVTHISYDEFGRSEKDWLPFMESSGNPGSYRSSGVEAGVRNYYFNNYNQDFPGAITSTEINPYSQKRFEPSPLGRVLEQGAPGEGWRLDLASDSDHTIKFGYGTNTVNEVRMYRVNLATDYTPTLENSSSEPYYLQNQLYKTITKDENWTTGKNHTMEEFKDKQGRVVLKRNYADMDLNADGDFIDPGETEVAHDTYYVYDDYGNLTYVLPPKSEPTDSNVASSPNKLSDLCYWYRYDNRNRLVEKKIPGKEPEFIIYNKLDQPVMTQDGNMRAKTLKEWLFTRYDAFGRVAYTGIVRDNRTRVQIQDETNDYSGELWVDRGSVITLGGTSVYYSNTGLPVTALQEVLTVNYYDDYDFPDLLQGISMDTESWGVPLSQNVKGLPTFAQSKILGTSIYKKEVMKYDEKGRMTLTRKRNDYFQSKDFVAHKLDFIGNITDTYTSHRKGTQPEILQIEHFDYDHVGRLLSHSQMLKDYGYPVEILTENTYNEIGQLVKKGVGNAAGRDRLQNVKFSYNIRGWLKGINNPENLGSDLFGFGINYNDPTGGATPLFNGNISEAHWDSQSQNTTGNPVSNQYLYSYDALNRISAAMDNTGSYNLGQMGYDKNGNIITLLRKGHTSMDGYGNITGFGTMDNLAYFYDSGNKLLKVSDAGNDTYGFKDDYIGPGTDTSNDYTYDANGNMLKDLNKGIGTTSTNGITYNHLNLPIQVKFNNSNTQKIDYIYDATGVKSEKKVTQGSTITKTFYAGNYIYEKIGSGSDVLKFFSQPEGYLEPNGSGGYDYIYQYKDHLGNVRLSYSDTNNNGTIEASTEILDEKNYYPFGGEHKGYNSNINGTYHPYGFGGKEENDELGLQWMDFGARNYDKWLGRWMNLDPLAEQMRRHSPYNYAFNNPIFFQDPDGMAPMAADWIDNGDGTYTAEAGDSASTLHSQHLEKKGFTFEQTDAIVESQYGENRVEDGIEKSNIDEGDVVKAEGEMVGDIRVIPNDSDMAETPTTQEQFGEIELDRTNANKLELILEVARLITPSPEDVVLKGLLDFTAPNSSRSNTRTTSEASSTKTTLPKGHNRTGQTVKVSGQNRDVIQGPNGGKYYINSNGNRTSLNRDGTKKD